jgi:transposase
VSEPVEGTVKPEGSQRVHRTVEEKRRIVEATFAPGTSISRVAREHGVNANQVFQWRYEYRKGILGGHPKAVPKLLPVVVAESEPSAVAVPAAATAAPPLHTGTIHVELPGGILIHIESSVDAQLVRAVLESLRR